MILGAGQQIRRANTQYKQLTSFYGLLQMSLQIPFFILFGDWALAPSNISIFVWRIVLDRLPSRVNLHKRKIILSAEEARVLPHLFPCSLVTTLLSLHELEAESDVPIRVVRGSLEDLEP